MMIELRLHGTLLEARVTLYADGGVMLSTRRVSPRRTGWTHMHYDGPGNPGFITALRWVEEQLGDGCHVQMAKFKDMVAALT